MQFNSERGTSSEEPAVYPEFRPDMAPEVANQLEALIAEFRRRLREHTEVRKG
jgi:hypothetical protein